LAKQILRCGVLNVKSAWFGTSTPKELDCGWKWT